MGRKKSFCAEGRWSGKKVVVDLGFEEGSGWEFLAMLIFLKHKSFCCIFERNNKLCIADLLNVQ